MLKVFTNGCFDLLHIGHVNALQQIKVLYPNCFLTIGLNGDSSVKKLKGDSRPIIKESHRRQMLLALEVVDEVIIFYEDTPRTLISKVMPDVIVKGIDYHQKEVVGFDDAKIGITLIHFQYEISTSDIIKKIKSM